MSRIGKMPIPVPSGTKVQIQDGTLVAEGPRGKVAQPLFEGYPVKIEDGVVTVERTGETGPERAKHGLLRAAAQQFGPLGPPEIDLVDLKDVDE